MGTYRKSATTIIFAGLLVSCGPQTPGPAPAPPPPHAPAIEPLPPGGAAKGLTVPAPAADGSFTTINSAVANEEALWHVRSALNVAALSCRADPTITTNYNALIGAQKVALKSAYLAETKRFGAVSNGDMDRHMTQVYNFFAQPPAQSAFCKAAAAEASQAAATSSAALPAYASEALGRLEAPILDYYRAYNQYEQQYAAWQASPNKIQVASRAAFAMRAGPVPTAQTWRIQLGAFTGQPAAEQAWADARAALPSLSQYDPHYEPVPGKPDLVRLQIGAANDRDGAIKLCATAAAGGLDCLPVSDE